MTSILTSAGKCLGMKLQRLNVCIGSIFVLLIGMSLIFSTLHSHHHIQWDHPPELADTGHCITSDTTICPVCGYLFKVDLAPPAFSQIPEFDSEVVSGSIHSVVQSPHLLHSRGRSPPSLI